MFRWPPLLSVQLFVILAYLLVCLPFFNFFLPSHSLSTHERGLFDYTMAWYHLRRTHFISFLFVLNQKALCVFTPSVFIDNDIKSIHSREKPLSSSLSKIQYSRKDMKSEEWVYFNCLKTPSLLRACSPTRSPLLKLVALTLTSSPSVRGEFYLFFSALDRRIVSILGYDQNEDVIYGVARNRRSYLRCNVTKCAAIPSEVWLRLRDLSTTILSTEIAFVPETGHDFTDTPISGYKLVDNDGNKWGGV